MNSDEPDPLGHLGDADALAGEDVAEIDFAAFEADAATPGDGDRVVVKGVGELIESPVDTRRSRVEVGGDFMPKACCGRR
jgi:hypothetical protein